MAQDTTHIRVSRATKKRLDREIVRLLKAYAEGRTEAVEPGECNNPLYRGMSHDALINRLLDLDERKRERAEQSRARKRKGKG